MIVSIVALASREGFADFCSSGKASTAPSILDLLFDIAADLARTPADEMRVLAVVGRSIAEAESRQASNLQTLVELKQRLAAAFAARRQE